MEDIINCDEFLFHNNELDNLISSLNKIIKNQKDNFAELCTCVAKIYYYCKDNSYMSKDNIFYNAYMLLEKFGFNRKSVERLVACYNKFVTSSSECDNVVANIKTEFFHFSPSKLYTLLSVSNTQLYNDIDKGVLKPTMTAKEIKEYVKSLKDNNEEKKKVLEDIKNEETTEIDNSFYNPNNHYDEEFFKSCTHLQLVAIAMTLQYEIEKLRKKK